VYGKGTCQAIPAQIPAQRICCLPLMRGSWFAGALARVRTTSPRRVPTGYSAGPKHRPRHAALGHADSEPSAGCRASRCPRTGDAVTRIPAAGCPVPWLRRASRRFVRIALSTVGRARPSRRFARPLVPDQRRLPGASCRCPSRCFASGPLSSNSSFDESGSLSPARSPVFGRP